MDHLFEVKKTQIEMVRDRGYTVSNYELSLLEEDFNYFVENYDVTENFDRGLLSEIYQKNGRNQLLVTYLEKPQDSKQMTVEAIREVIEQAKIAKVEEIIIVTQLKLSSSAEKELTLSGLNYQIFYDSDLSYNPTKHVDTPKHELLTQEEAKEKMRELKADVSKLLIMKSNDPIVRYYNWPVGGLIRIHREDFAVSILAPKSINYRIIVP